MPELPQDHREHRCCFCVLCLKEVRSSDFNTGQKPHVGSREHVQLRDSCYNALPHRELLEFRLDRVLNASGAFENQLVQRCRRCNVEVPVYSPGGRFFTWVLHVHDSHS